MLDISSVRVGRFVHDGWYRLRGCWMRNEGSRHEWPPKCRCRIPRRRTSAKPIRTRYHDTGEELSVGTTPCQRTAWPPGYHKRSRWGTASAALASALRKCSSSTRRRSCSGYFPRACLACGAGFSSWASRCPCQAPCHCPRNRCFGDCCAFAPTGGTACGSGRTRAATRPRGGTGRAR